MVNLLLYRRRFSPEGKAIGWKSKRMEVESVLMDFTDPTILRVCTEGGTLRFEGIEKMSYGRNPEHFTLYFGENAGVYEDMDARDEFLEFLELVSSLGIFD